MTADFAGPGILTVTDPVGDVGLPANKPNGAVSGWDMVDLRLTYNATTDTLYVGINTFGIAGDADGDGDPGRTSAWLAADGGVDLPDLGGTESIAVYFDLNKDGTFDIIAGISSSTNITGFTVANFSGSPYNPSAAFGTPLPGNTGIHTIPTAATPDFEFTITNFSTLTGQDALLAGFRVWAFMGSLQDDGIGEDYIQYEQNPHTTATIASSAAKVYPGGSVNLTVTEANPSGLYSRDITSPQVAVTRNGTPIATLTAPPNSGDNGDGILNPGENWTWTNIPSGAITGPTTFVATGSGIAPGDFLVTYPDDPGEQDHVTVEAISPQLCIDKTVDCNKDGIYSDTETWYGPSDNASWKVVVWNCGDAPVYNITVSDTNGHNFGGKFDLAVGANQTFTYTTTISATTTNNATAVGTDAIGGTVGPVSDSATNKLITPKLCIDKTVDCNKDGIYSDTETWYGPSDNASWKVVVWNCGDAPVYNITVSDTNGHNFGGKFDLAVGANQTFTYTTTISATTTNNATAVGTDAIGGTVGPVSDSATNKLITPKLCIDKTVDCNKDGIYSDTETWYGPSDNASWKVVVWNCGDAPVYNITVSDTNGHNFGGKFDLAVGANQTFTYTTTISATTTNNATAVGTDAIGGTVGPVSDSATNKLINPKLCIDKTVDCNKDGIYSDVETWYGPSDNASWKVVVWNCGDAPVYNITVTDTNGHNFGGKFDLAVGANQTFTYTTTISATTTNNATAAGTDAIGGTVGPVSDSATNKLITPKLCIDKTVDCNKDGIYSDVETWYGPSDNASWKVVVWNCGDAPVYNITVTDTNGHNFGGKFDLAVGANQTFTYTTTISATTTNNATAAGTDAIGGTVGPVSDSATNKLITPKLCIDKTVDCNKDGIYSDVETWYGPSDNASWKVVVWNCGDAPVYNITVTDTNGHDFGGKFDLAVGANQTFTYTTTISATTTNNATAAGTDAIGGTVGPVSDSATNKLITPKLCIDKTVDCNKDGIYSDVETWYGPSDNASWKVVVWNCGDAPVYNITVTDTNGHNFGGKFDLAVGANQTFTYTTTISATTTNNATAAGTDAIGGTVGPVSDSATNKLITPKLCIDKTVDCNKDGIYSDVETWYGPSDNASWKVVVWNCGDAPVYNITVTDTNGHNFGGKFDLAVGANQTFTYTTTISATTTNNATAAGTDAIGGTVGPVSDSATNKLITPKLCIDKTVDCNKDGIYSDVETWYGPSDNASWKVVVWNCGDAPVYNITVTDTNGHNFGGKFDLAVGANQTFTYTTTISATTTNNATAAGTDAIGGTVGPVSDSATNKLITPKLCIDKTVDCNKDGIYSDVETWYGPSDNASWKVVVWNCGDAPVYNITVTDTNGHNFGGKFDLAVGANQTFTYTTTISATTTNNATAAGTDAIGGTVGPVSDSATNKLITPKLCIDKTVDCNKDGVYLSEDTGSYGDTPSWKIDVHNCGDSPLHAVNVSDTNGMSWGPFDLAIDETWSVNYTGAAIYETTTNTAWAKGMDQLGGTVTAGPVSATNKIECKGCLKICKYEDKNGNRQRDDGEPWLSGWVFSVTDPNGNSWSVTTDAAACSGSYADGLKGCSECTTCETPCLYLPPGDYTVTETLKDGWTCTTGNPRKVTVTCDTTTVDFGNQKQCTGCLQICKYEDKNGNHQKDYGESYLSGWTFNVTDSQGNSQSVTTGGSGGTCGGDDYCVTICNLAAGQYTITETPQSGWTNTDPADGSLKKTVTVECGKTTTVKFGNQQGCNGCLQICKYEDKNGNHQKDEGESYLSGWTFNVTDSQGNSQSVTTGGSGGTCGGDDYCVTICNLAAGQYTITETPQSGWTNTDPADGSRTKTVTVACGTTKTVKFGNQQGCNGCLQICKYEDKNGNGQKDSGESYLSGWEFTVTNSNGYSKTVTTGGSGGTCGDGDYCVTICDLAAGNYTITETPQSGWTNTDPADGSLTKTVTVECGTTRRSSSGTSRDATVVSRYVNTRIRMATAKKIPASHISQVGFLPSPIVMGIPKQSPPAVAGELVATVTTV